MRTDTIYHINYWVKKGFTIDESKERVESSKKETSWRCKEFWIRKGYTEQDAILKISQKQSEIALKRDKLIKRSDPYDKEYYINKNIINPDEINKLIQESKDKSNQYLKWSKDELKKIIGKRKKTYYNKLPSERKEINKKRGRTKQQLIEKYGKEYTDIISQCRGNANRRRFGCAKSKISIELFNHLSDLNKEKKFIYGHKENYILIKSIKNRKGYFVDFYYEKDKKIIEFNGDFWHFNPNKYSSEDYCILKENKIIAKNIWEEDKIKIGNLINNGYSVLVIWENEYIKNKNDVIKKCNEFINQK
jgi:very-short-patch-repair endonuclease